MLTLDQTFDYQDQTVRWGQIGSGSPLVLVRGFPWSAQAWRNIAPWLAQKHTVYYFDMLGCGDSAQFAGQDVAPPVQSDLLAALMGHWSLERPEIVGHDFGGLAVLRGYFLNGLRYSRVTLLDAVAVLPSGSPLFAHVHAHEQAFAGLPAYAHEALFTAYTRNAALTPFPDAVTDLYLRPWQGEAGQPAFYRQIAHAGAEYIEEVQSRYTSMDCPVHLVWGEHDSFIPVEQGRRLAKQIDADIFTVAANAAHAIQEDAPEAIVGALLA